MTRRAAQMKYVRSCECYAIMALRRLPTAPEDLARYHRENAALFNEGAGNALVEFGLASVLRPGTFAPAVALLFPLLPSVKPSDQEAT